MDETQHTISTNPPDNIDDNAVKSDVAGDL